MTGAADPTDLSPVQVKKSRGRPPAYLTVGQAAAKKGVTPMAVRKAIYAGRLPAALLGEGPTARWIIRIRDVEAWTPVGPGPRKGKSDD